MIRAIIFDCFGVLTGDIWKEYVAGLPEAQQEPARALNRAHDAGMITFKEFLDEIYDLTGTVPKVVEGIVGDEMQKNRPLFEYISLLKESYKIGLLSNIGSNWVRESFLSDEEKRIFDEIALSFELGMAKPDPRIFQVVAERLGCEPSECIMVDDGPGNVSAAKSIGMQAIEYKTFVPFKTQLESLISQS